MTLRRSPIPPRTKDSPEPGLSPALRAAAGVPAVVCLFLWVLVRAPTLPAQDWPCWLGPGRNGTVSGFDAPADWPDSLTENWHRKIGLGESTPALVGDRLYVFAREENEEVILALNARDGAPVWRHSYPAVAVTGPAEPYPGPRSSPAVAGGKVIALGVGGVVTCLDAARGELVWRRDDFTNALPRFFTSASPLVAEGLCILHLGGPGEGCVVALALDTGRSRWTWPGEGPAYASAVLLTLADSKQVVLLTEKSLVGLDFCTGRLLWRIPTPLKPGYWNSATPLVEGQTVYYTGQGTGTRAIRVEATGEGVAVRELWHNDRLGTVYNTPVVWKGRLFGLSDRGQYFCLDARTGKTMWVSTNRVSNFGTLLRTGNLLVSLTEKAGLVCIKPSRERFEEEARFSVGDPPFYAFPLLSGNRIFIRNRHSLTLWTVKSDSF